MDLLNKKRRVDHFDQPVLHLSVLTLITLAKFYLTFAIKPQRFVATTTN